MNKIFKYPLKGSGALEISMPETHKVLSVAVQGKQVVLYALVNDTSRMVKKTVYVLLTGFPAAVGNTPFIGTVILDNGAYVLHVFAEIS